MWKVYILVELKDGNIFFEDFISEKETLEEAIHDSFGQAMTKYFKVFHHIACCGKRSAKKVSRGLHALQ